MLTQNVLIGVRDPYGIRPLVIGKLKNSYVLASKTCALDIIGAKFIRKLIMVKLLLLKKINLKVLNLFHQKKLGRVCLNIYILQDLTVF